MALHLIAFIYLVLVTFYMKAQNLDQLRDSVTLEEQRTFIKINVLLDILDTNYKPLSQILVYNKVQYTNGMVILGMESEPISLNNQDRVDHGQPLMTRIKKGFASSS